MSPQQDDIRTLERAILQDASGEAQRILTDARARVTSLRQEAQARLESERAATVGRAEDEAASLLDQTVAEVRIDAQSLRLRRREQLLDRVFSDARARIADAAQWPDYAEVALRLTRDAAKQIDSDAMIVKADAATARYLGEEVLSSLGQDAGVRLVMGASLTEGIGVILETPDGHRRFDNTLENRLNRLHDRLRAGVFHILMGEEP